MTSPNAILIALRSALYDSPGPEGWVVIAHILAFALDEGVYEGMIADYVVASLDQWGAPYPQMLEVFLAGHRVASPDTASFLAVTDAARGGDLGAAWVLWGFGRAVGDQATAADGAALMGDSAGVALLVEEAWMRQDFEAVARLARRLGLVLGRETCQAIEGVLKRAHHRRTKRRFTLRAIIEHLSDAHHSDAPYIFRDAGTRGGGVNWATTAALTMPTSGGIRLGVERCGWPVRLSRVDGWRPSFDGKIDEDALDAWARASGDDRITVPTAPSSLARPTPWVPPEVSMDALRYTSGFEELVKEHRHYQGLLAYLDKAPTPELAEHISARIEEVLAASPPHFALIYLSEPQTHPITRAHVHAALIDAHKALEAEEATRDSDWLGNLTHLTLNATPYDPPTLEQAEHNTTAMLEVVRRLDGVTHLNMRVHRPYGDFLRALAANADLTSRLLSLELNVGTYKEHLNLDPSDWLGLLAGCRELEKLDLWVYGDFVDQHLDVLYDALRDCPALTDFKMRDSTDRGQLTVQATLEALSGSPLTSVALEGFLAVGDAPPRYTAYSSLELLDIDRCALTAASLRQLLPWFEGADVKTLNLKSNHLLDAEALRLLATTPCLAQLEALDLDYLRLDVEKIEALAVGLKRLERLRLSNNEMGDEGALALARCGFMRSLKDLHLYSGKIGPAGIAAIANATLGLERLNLTFNPIGDDGLIALARSPVAASVKALELRACDVRGKGMAALCAANTPRLTHLDLNDNKLGVTGARALAAWPHAARLETLDLRSASIPKKGRELLKLSPHIRRGSVRGLEGLEGWK